MILKLKFFDTLAPIVVEEEKPVPPHPPEAEVAVPVKPRALTVVPPAFTDFVKLDAVLLAGITQDPNVSAEADDEIPSEIAQKQDKNRILPVTSIYLTQGF
jgi:hypothetical protein